MNAPAKTTSASSVVATLATVAAHVDPATFHKDTPPGVAGVLVFFGPPSTKPAPSTMRNTFEDAIVGRALPVDATPAMHERASAFLASLPDVVSPVAALGIAVNHATDGKSKWVHNRTFQKASRHTYCAANVTADTVSIHGAGTCAEASADGTLTIESGVPQAIADRLRAAYLAARGVVETSRVSALIAAYLTKMGGRAIGSAAYLLPSIDPVTCGVLAGLSDLGGFALTYAVADPAQVAALAAPVTQSIEEQIADVTEAARLFVEKARDVANGATVEVTTDDGTTKTRNVSIKSTSIDTLRANIENARKAASLWRDRLQLASLDVDDALTALDADADAASRAALEAMKARK